MKKKKVEREKGKSRKRLKWRERGGGGNNFWDNIYLCVNLSDCSVLDASEFSIPHLRTYQVKKNTAFMYLF